MKRLFFSLCTLAPLLLQAEESNSVFETMLLEDEGYTIDDLEEDLGAASGSEEHELKEPLSVEITYKNADDSSIKNSDGRPLSKSGQQNVRNFNIPINHPGYFGFAEFLWWQVNETALDYATHKNFATNPQETATALALGHVHTVSIDWNPGFRIGLGYRFDKDLWELGGVYTYYYTKGDDSVSCGECKSGNPALPSFIDMNVASNLGAVIAGKANFHFWYHIGDIEFAKPINLGKYTSCRFVVGPSMGFIQQHFHTTSIDNTNTFSPCPAQQTKTRMDWNFKGAGIKVGIDSHWNVFDRFNFLFGAHLTALYGFYVNKWHAFRLLDPVGTTCTPDTELVKNKFSNWTLKDRRNVFGTKIFGGISYNHPFKSFNVELYINYELNTWFNLTDQYRMEGMPLTADNIRSMTTTQLNISGVDFGAKVNF
jgi:hypothetical protein